VETGLYSLYTTSQKIRHRVFVIISSSTDHFQNSFIITVSWKFTIKWWLKITTHFKRVATLPCDILMQENQRAQCAGAVLMKDEQYSPEFQRILSQAAPIYYNFLLSTVSIFGIVCNYQQTIFVDLENLMKSLWNGFHWRSQSTC